MARFQILAFFLIFSLSQATLGQSKQRIKPVVIPFTLTEHNNLSVQAILNSQDTVQLMFHTAANAVTLIDEAVKRTKSIRFDGVDSVSSWGGNNSSRFSKSNLLQLADQQWPNTPIWENTNSGPNTDGKFGMDLFANRIIEIDFDKQLIILHQKLPTKARKYEKLKLVFDHDYLFLEASCQIDNKALANRYLLHSGYAGTLLLDDTFVNNNQVDQKLKIVAEKSLKDSFGNVIKTQKAILPALTIGNQTLVDVPVGFFKGAIGRQKMSIIGGDIIKRFNLIIDASRDYIYLKPNSLHKSVYTNV